MKRKIKNISKLLIVTGCVSVLAYNIAVAAPLVYDMEQPAVRTEYNTPNKINLTGVSAGSATITCKQTLKGKTTVVGKAKITVHNAKAVFVDPSNWNLGIYRREFF